MLFIVFLWSGLGIQIILSHDEPLNSDSRIRVGFFFSPFFLYEGIFTQWSCPQLFCLCPDKNKKKRIHCLKTFENICFVADKAFAVTATDIVNVSVSGFPWPFLFLGFTHPVLSFLSFPNKACSCKTRRLFPFGPSVVFRRRLQRSLLRVVVGFCEFNSWFRAIVFERIRLAVYDVLKLI